MRNSWAMTGQSVVHVSSRNVRAMVLPFRLASDTGRPCWSTRRNAGAGLSTAWGAPSTAWARTGSACGSVAAAAMGTAPSRVTPIAPMAATERNV